MTSTPTSPRILIIEDEPNDLILLTHALTSGGFTFRTNSVETREDFLREIAGSPPDLILSDHGVPSFDGFTALALAREHCPDTPFIFVSGSLDDREVREARRRGAHNWVPKSQLAALVPVVQEALALAEERTRRRQTERELRATQERLNLLASGVQDCAIVFLDPNGRITGWNPGAELLTGYAAEEMHDRPFGRCYTPEDRERGQPEADLQAAARDGRIELEGRRVRKGGGRFWARVVITMLPGKAGGFVEVTTDLTERMQAEEALAHTEDLLDVLAQSSGRVAIYLLDLHGAVFTWNRSAQRLEGYTAREILGQPWTIFFPSEDVARRQPDQLLARATAESRAQTECWRLRADGTRYWAGLTLTARPDVAGRAQGFALLVRDLTAERAAEMESRSVARQRARFRPARNGHHEEPAPAETAPRRDDHGATRCVSPLQRVRRATEATDAAQRSIDALISQTRTPWGAPALFNSAQVEKLEDTMRVLRGKLAERELALAEVERKLESQERDLASAEALLVAREQLVAAMSAAQQAVGADATGCGFSPAEIAALKQLKQELERQEQTLKDARLALREREEFVEQSEATLLAKIQAQQERETELDQREEDVARPLSRAPHRNGESAELIEAVLAEEI